MRLRCLLALVLALNGLQTAAQSTLPDAPLPQSHRTGWHELKASAPKRHNWFYRHPVLLGLIAGGTIGTVVAIKQYHTCSHRIDGFPYDGTYPCPKSCDGPGVCYWPAK